MEDLDIRHKRNRTFCVKSQVENSVCIDSCDGCYIYILTSPKLVSINKCQNTVIFIENANEVKTTECTKVQVIAASQNVHVQKSKESDFYLFIQNQPKVTDNSTKIRFAPYNACYEKNVPEYSNQWDKAIVEPESQISLIEASEFVPFVVPFGAEPKGISAPLPSAYSRSLAWRERLAEERRNMILEFCKKSQANADFMEERIRTAFSQDVLEGEKGAQIRQLANTEYF